MARTVKWPYQFVSIDRPEDKQSFAAELARELAPDHPLYGVSVGAIGRRNDDDDVLFELRDGTTRVAEVHLTWKGSRERVPWPTTAIFSSLDEWTASRSQADI